MFRILAIAGALLGLASVAQADVWRWTDPNGTAHYSDSWVPGSTLVKTDSRSGYSSSTDPAASASAPSANRTEPAPTDPAQAQRDQRAVEADVAKAQAERCKKAQQAYEKAVESRRLYKPGTGEDRVYLSDAEADAYRMQLLSARREACGS